LRTLAAPVYCTSYEGLLKSKWARPTGLGQSVTSHCGQKGGAAQRKPMVPLAPGASAG